MSRYLIELKKHYWTLVFSFLGFSICFTLISIKDRVKNISELNSNTTKLKSRTVRGCVIELADEYANTFPVEERDMQRKRIMAFIKMQAHAKHLYLGD